MVSEYRRTQANGVRNGNPPTGRAEEVDIVWSIWKHVAVYFVRGVNGNKSCVLF